MEPATVNVAEMAGNAIGLGLLVVFICLILLIVVINLLSVILKDRKKAKQETVVVKEVAEPIVEAPVKDDMQEDELIAVLTAAVAACMDAQGEKNDSPFVIRSYKRIGRSSAWNKAGRDSQLRSW